MTTEKAVTDNLQAMMDAAESVQEDGEVRPGTVVNTPTGENPLPMAVGTVTGPGYKTVYRRDNGKPVKVNYNMLSAQLQKRDGKTGELAFTAVDPGYRPVPGKFMCWLNPDHPDYSDYEYLGRTCSKKGIPSEYQAIRHMQSKHPAMYESINLTKQQKREDEDRDVQRQLLQAALGTQPAPVAAPVTPVEAAPEPEPYYEPVSRKCDVCGEMIDAESSKVMGVMVAKHNRTHK